MTNGVIVEETILERGFENVSGSQEVRYTTKIRAKVRAGPPQDVRHFTVEVKLNSSVFLDGEDVQLSIRSSQDGYVSLFNVTPDGHITILAPNRLMKELKILANKELVFPTKYLRNKGGALRAWVQDTFRGQTEYIKAIVTKEPLLLPGLAVQEGLYRTYQPANTALLRDLLKALSALDPSDWTETTTPYRVDPS